MSKPPKLLAEWFWTDRWMGSSAFLLPMEARGLYREMLTQAWRRGACLPLEHEAIRRAVGCTEQEWDRAWPYIQRYWRVSDDGVSMVNDTQLQVYAEATAAAENTRGRAAAAARKRWERAKSPVRAAQAHAQASARALLVQCPPSPSPITTPPTPPNGPEPIVDGRREELESEGYRLIREIAGVTGEDPTEVLARASRFKGHEAPSLAGISARWLVGTLNKLRQEAIKHRSPKATKVVPPWEKKTRLAEELEREAEG